MNDSEWEPYFTALGRFMHCFASMENGLNSVVSQYLWKSVTPLTNNTFQMLQAATGGRRFGPLADVLKRLLKTAGDTVEVRERISKILGHAGEIQYLRDRLAHNGADFSTADKCFQSSNVVTSADGEKVDSVLFTPQMLLDAASDLSRMPFMILRQIDPGFLEMADRHLGGIESYRDQIAALEQPWRYKPSELRHKAHRPPKSPPRAEQPPPSQP